MSAEALQRKKKIDMIGDRLRENVKILSELKEELCKIPDSFKDKIKQSQTLVPELKETIIETRINKSDDRPINPSTKQDLYLPVQKPSGDCAIIITPLASKQMFKTTSDMKVPGYAKDRFAKSNNSMYSVNKQRDLNTSKANRNSESKQSFLRKRSKLKYDPMEAARQDKIKSTQPDLSVTDNQ